MSPIADCHICLFIRYPIFQHIYKPIISRCFLQETIKGDIAGGPGDVRLRRPERSVDIRTVRARQGLNIQKKDIHRMSLFCIFESTRRDSNPRPSPWQGDTPPLSHSCIGNIPSKPHIELHQPPNLHLTFLDKPSTD